MSDEIEYDSDTYPDAFPVDMDDDKFKKRRLTLASVNTTEEIDSNGQLKMHST